MIIGTCGECGGPVVLPELWGGIIPPTGKCQNCGATEKKSYGRKIEMEKPKYQSPFKGVFK